MPGTDRITSETLVERLCAIDEAGPRGRDAWSGMLESAPVADSVRYEVLKRDHVCVLCGTGPKDPVLEVDDIIPRS